MKRVFEICYYKTDTEAKEPRPTTYYKDAIKHIRFWEWLYRKLLMPIGPAVCLPGIVFACVCGAYVDATGNALWLIGLILGFVFGGLGLYGSMTYYEYDERLMAKYCAEELAEAEQSKENAHAVWKAYLDAKEAEEDAKRLADCYKVLDSNDAYALFRLVYKKDIKELE